MTVIAADTFIAVVPLFDMLVHFKNDTDASEAAVIMTKLALARDDM